MEIPDKIALVTGAASGIGRATALRLAREGARVVASDVDAAGGEETVRMIKETGGEAVFVRGDVSNDADLQQVFEQTVHAYGGLDILFNNAGITTGVPPFPESPPEKWNRTLEINLWSVIRGTQLAIPLMQARGGGVIVNTASMAGLNGFALDPVYAATKGGVVMFTRSLAPLKQQHNISVVAICPGAVDTAIWRGAEDPRLRTLIDQIAYLAPDEIADAVVGLIRDEQSAGRALRISVEVGREYVP